MAEDKGGYRQINKSLNICVFEEYLKGQTANLPKLENVEQVSSRVLRVLGQNPGKVSFKCMLQACIAMILTRLQVYPAGYKHVHHRYWSAKDTHRYLWWRARMGFIDSIYA